MKEALYWEKADGAVRCLLCPHDCKIVNGITGVCGVRQNIDGKLYSLVYGEATSVSLDPVEKKPLYHFHPGEYILSLGTKGCNFKCPFCQNWAISQDLGASAQKITSQWVVDKAKECKSFGIAYTYNEPFIWYEFVLETAKLAKGEGLENVLVTNGFVNPKPLEEMLPFIGAMNIDLKSIDDEFYRKYCKGSLEPVLQTIKTSVKACHVELTNLVIPGLNDSEDNFIRLVDWIYTNAGADVPLHFSRYFPCYKMDQPVTSKETLEKAYKIAKKKLRNVYLGNI
ncbi:MAG: AmmeMemoRadiSam system radical SAM enzyme [Candidatus Omnitrophica bacterium]|nr:AmmeMemoRadiSam system radical SAM enzyme [Candidatus Omnitrophota bacterium]